MDDVRITEDPTDRTNPLQGWAETLFGGHADAVLIHRRGRIAYANHQLGVLIGLDPHFLQGRPALELYPDREYPTVLARLQAAAFAAQPAAAGHHALARRDGRTVEVEVRTLVLPIAGAAPLVVEILRRL